MHQGSALSTLLFVIVMEAISREFRVALQRELLYADDWAMIAETEEELIKRLNEWKDNVESKGMRVNMNKTKVMITGERQKVRQKAVTWPCGVCSKGVIYVLQQNRQRWYGHVLQKEDDDWVKKCMEYEVDGPRPRGRPKRTWREVVKENCQACKLNTEDAMDRSKWRKLIKDVR